MAGLHMVERAVIMAAGRGTRLRPVTLHSPKPLVRVHGQRIIDSIIDGLHSQGIHEIHIVVGYLREAFRVLENKYTDLHFIDNPRYATENNISSLYAARRYLENAIILDGDQLIYDPQVLSPQFSLSGYNCVWTERETPEWLLQVEDGRVVHCAREGGRRGWQLYSISRWTAEDGRKLRQHVEQAQAVAAMRQLYWDDLPLFCHARDYILGIREMPAGAVREIDSLQELVALDASYERYMS